MTDNKNLGNTETVIDENTQNSVDELVGIVNNHFNPVSPSSPTVISPTGSTRIYTPPLMGTSARAAKRRIDSDSGPVRIEGTDTYNQQLQHHYQNVRQIIEEQQQNSNIDTLPESRQSFSAKRNYFEDRFKTPQATYDSSSSQQQGQKEIITTTTITSSSNAPDRTSSSSNESPSVDRVLEEAVELQKLSNINSTKTYSQPPLIIERTEEYQVFLDSHNHEVRRTPSISRTSIIQTTKTGHATDLDQAQAQIEHLTDDHQAIQHLTRALQEHNVTTINEYKRLPSQTSQNPNIILTSSSTLPSEVLHDRTNLPIRSTYSVIDAILNNPLGTHDNKTNNLLNIRYNDIVTNLHNPEYLNTLKKPVKTTKETKVKPVKPPKETKAKPVKPPKETKVKENKLKKKLSDTTDTVEHAIITPLVNTREVSTLQTKEPITTTISSEKTPLIDPKVQTTTKISSGKTSSIDPKESTTSKISSEKIPKESITTKTSSEQTPLINPKESITTKTSSEKTPLIDPKASITTKTSSEKTPLMVSKETTTTTTTKISSEKSSLIVPKESTTTKISSEQTPLIDPKQKKKQDKENKKQIKTKSKSKSKNADYQVLDAIIGSPVSIRLPDSYLVKYNVSPPLSQSSLLQSMPPSNTAVTTTTATAVTSKDKNIPTTDKDQTSDSLTKIVKDLQTHHTISQSTNATPLSSPPSKVNTRTETKESIIKNKQSVPVVNEVIHQQPLLEQQYSKKTSNQTETRPQSETIKPRIIYRYMDEQGRILKISSTAPSQLRDQPAQQQYVYRHTDPTYYYGRHIVIDDDRRHLLPEYEQHATWQGESKLPTTVTRRDLELRDKRIPQLSEQSVPTGRTVPVSVDHERSSKKSSQQPRTYHYPNQQNVKLAWIPLSYPTEPQYIPSGTGGYDTDSTISERSATYRPYDYGPAESHYRYSNRPIYNDYYYSSPSYYPPAPTIPYGGRGISPEYGGLSRNYIEVFRGGDFRETKPSEIYSLPLNEHIRTSPILPTNSRHSRYDQYQSERYGTISNRQNIPSSQQDYYYSNSLPNSRYQNIPPTTVHTSTNYTHRSPHHRTVQGSPTPDYRNYIRQSKSFDYRPLRTKLQREYKITPNLLVDEWDYPQSSDNTKCSTTTSTNRSGFSSPDDVFITNQTTKA
jgi:hypothetical protein